MHTADEKTYEFILDETYKVEHHTPWFKPKHRDETGKNSMADLIIIILRRIPPSPTKKRCWWRRGQSSGPNCKYVQ